MNPLDVTAFRHDSDRPAGDVLVGATQRALTEWRAAFDDRLDALEAALQDPSRSHELGALMVAFARVAGDEAEASARQAGLEAQGAAQAVVQQAAEQAAAEARQQAEGQAEASLDTMRRSLADTRRAFEETQRTNDEMRRGLDGARRTNDDLRQALDEARQAAADAEAQVRQGDEERRELVGAQTQLTRQLDDARKAAATADGRITVLRDQLAEALRDAEVKARDLQAFQQRLEQAVRDAEQRAQGQEMERRRLEEVVQEAVARATAAAAEIHRQRDQLAHVTGEVETIRPQLEVALARVTSLERELQDRDRGMAELRVELERSRQAARSAPAPAVVSASPTPATSLAPPTPAAPTAPPTPTASRKATAVEMMPPADVNVKPAAVPRAATPTAATVTSILAALAPAAASEPVAPAAPVGETRAPESEKSGSPAISASSPAMQWLQSLRAEPAAAATNTPIEPANADAPGQTAASSRSPIHWLTAASDEDVPAAGEASSEVGAALHDADGGVARFAADTHHAQADLDSDSDSEHGDGADDDEEPSADSEGVFSTVADALRAWTAEPILGNDGQPIVTAAPVPSVPADAAPAGAATAAEGTSGRPLPAASPYDLVRKSPRYDLSTRRIHVLIDDVPGDLVDLSNDGAQVVTSGMLKPSSHVRVAFPSGGPLARAKAKIAWSRIEPPQQGGGELQYRAGLTFTKIDPKTIDRVLNAPDAPPAGSTRRGGR